MNSNHDMVTEKHKSQLEITSFKLILIQLINLIRTN